jgi:hypothetical protein
MDMIVVDKCPMKTLILNTPPTKKTTKPHKNKKKKTQKQTYFGIENE